VRQCHRSHCARRYSSPGVTQTVVVYNCCSHVHGGKTRRCGNVVDITARRWDEYAQKLAVGRSRITRTWGRSEASVCADNHTEKAIGAERLARGSEKLGSVLVTGWFSYRDEHQEDCQRLYIPEFSLAKAERSHRWSVCLPKLGSVLRQVGCPGGFKQSP
jgi:hypothetical protein